MRLKFGLGVAQEIALTASSMSAPAKRKASPRCVSARLSFSFGSTLNLRSHFYSDRYDTDVKQCTRVFTTKDTKYHLGNSYTQTPSR